MSPIFHPLKGDLCYKIKDPFFKGALSFKLLTGKKVRVKEAPPKVFLSTYMLFPPT
jgi:hypothetical protein